MLNGDRLDHIKCQLDVYIYMIHYNKSFVYNITKTSKEGGWGKAQNKLFSYYASYIE